MTRNLHKEKRLHPRMQHQLPLQVIANGYDFVTATKNISCVGAYCNVGKYIPPFTRVAVKIVLPKADKVSKEEDDVQCRGVVVRTEDAMESGFNIAIFFNKIETSQQQKISRYLNLLLPEKSPGFARS